MLSCAKWHANVKLHARDTNLYQRKYTRFLLSKTNWVQHRTRISSLCNAVSLTYRIVSRRYCISVLICLHHALHRTYLHPFFHKNRDASQVHWRVQTNIGYDRSSSMDHRRWIIVDGYSTVPPPQNSPIQSLLWACVVGSKTFRCLLP